jgi:cytochrome c oxidase assembly factor CtaG
MNDGVELEDELITLLTELELLMMLAPWLLLLAEPVLLLLLLLLLESGKATIESRKMRVYVIFCDSVLPLKNGLTSKI